MSIDLEDVHYLYEIRNRVNEKKYIGVTNNYKSRMYWHAKNLADGQHSNSHLQRAYNLYGPSAFEYDLIGVAETEQEICLDEMAAIWEAWPNCYNKLMGVPWTKYTPQNQMRKKKDETKPNALFSARIKKARKSKKKTKARKRRERKEMLKRTRDEANKQLKKTRKPVINKLSKEDMHELKMDSIINKALAELKV